MSIEPIIILLFAAASLFLFVRRRTAQDVISDLFEDEDLEEAEVRIEEPKPSEKDLKSAGKASRFLPLLFGGGALVFLVLLGHDIASARGVIAFLFTCSVSYLVLKHRGNAESGKERRKQELLLPIVMERMVMAVEAGSDVYAALTRVVELEDELQSDQSVKAGGNQVIELLREVLALTENGIPLEQALYDVGSEQESPAVRHAFLYMGVAHREGGELVLPLRELSDATQQYYQETVEESIAKLPVKATVPLVVTFAGLLIFFITPPILQLSEMNPANSSFTAEAPDE